jgi:hypothetical protein
MDMTSAAACKRVARFHVLVDDGRILLTGSYEAIPRVSFRVRSGGAGVGRPEPDEGGPPPTPLGWSVGIANDQGMASQQVLHHLPLEASPPAVDEADLLEPPRCRCPQVLLHHRADVPGLEGVQVQDLLDGDGDRGAAALAGIGRHHGFRGPGTGKRAACS